MRIGRVVTGRVGNIFALGAVVKLGSDGSSLQAYIPGLKKVVEFKRGEAHTIDSCGGSGASRTIADAVREAAGVQVDGNPLTDAQIAQINKSAQPKKVSAPSKTKVLPRKATKGLPTVKAKALPSSRQTLASKAAAITKKVAASLGRKSSAKGKTSKTKAKA